METTSGLATAGTSRIPPGRDKAHQTPLWASGPRLQILGQNDAYSEGSSSGTSPLPPPQGKTPEAAGTIYATKLLPQEHYVSPGCQPSANYQPRDITMNCPQADLDPSWGSLNPEMPMKPRNTRRVNSPW